MKGKGKELMKGKGIGFGFRDYWPTIAPKHTGGHLSFPTFVMSFAASHSGCQASSKIGATPAHTGKVHTQVVSCLCFVSTERTRQASCCTSSRRELNFRSYVDRFCIWVLEKWQLSHGFAVDEAYFLGFSTVLSEKCNCHTVSLWDRAYSLGFGTLEAGIKLSSFPLGHPKTGSVSSVQERLVLLASQRQAH